MLTTNIPFSIRDLTIHDLARESSWIWRKKYILKTFILKTGSCCLKLAALLILPKN